MLNVTDEKEKFSACQFNLGMCNDKTVSFPNLLYCHLLKWEKIC